MALAPVRICDLGGWSDTWFARRGSVLNIAVKPYVQCIVEVDDGADAEERFFLFPLMTTETVIDWIPRTWSSASIRCLMLA